MEKSKTINIKQHFTIELTCPICLNQYDFAEHIPMIICCNQHYVCLVCIEKSFEYVEADQDQIPCHFCKEPVYADCVDRFRLMEEFVHTANAVDQYGKDIQALVDKLVIQNQELWKALKEQRSIVDQKSKMLEVLSVHRQYQKRQNTNSRQSRSSSRRMVTSSIHSNTKTTKKQPRYRQIVSHFQHRGNILTQTNNFQGISVFLKVQSPPERQKADPNFNFTFHLQEEFPPLSSKNGKSISRVQSNKRPLPYMIANPRIISSQDLKRIAKNEPIPQKIDQRTNYFIILGKYDFSLLRELDLSRSGLNQKHFDRSNLKDCFPCLEVLILSKNRFTCIPALICQLTSLRRLNMSNNAIVRVSQQLVELANLQFLDLWDNLLKVAPNVIYLMKSLQRVDLSNNRIDHHVPCLGDIVGEVRVKVDLFGNPAENRIGVPFWLKHKKKTLKKPTGKHNRTIL